MKKNVWNVRLTVIEIWTKTYRTAVQKMLIFLHKTFFFSAFSTPQHTHTLKSLKCYGIFYHTVGKILLWESSTYFLSFHFLHFELSTDTISVCFSVYRVWYPPELLSRAICYRQRLLSTKCGSKMRRLPIAGGPNQTERSTQLRKHPVPIRWSNKSH